jgi:3-hydroxyisobutyrate dehydrogenase-like beta-hydroxyacid dehydrogenase
MAAEKGTLTFMIGISSPSSLDVDIDQRNYSIVRSICSTMGTNLFDCGGPSLGLATKLSNNYVSGLIAIATAEGMNLGMRLGVQPMVLRDAFSTSTAQSWVNGE